MQSLVRLRQQQDYMLHAGGASTATETVQQASNASDVPGGSNQGHTTQQDVYIHPNTEMAVPHWTEVTAPN